MKPEYCVNGQAESCQVCSYVNYGRDCQNNPIIKLISFEDFTDWHTAHGLEYIAPETLRAAYEVYIKLFNQGGKDFADDQICGHEVWII